MSRRQTIEVLVGSGPVRERVEYTRMRAEQGAVVINEQRVIHAFHGRTCLKDNGLRDQYRNVQHHMTIQAIKAGRDVLIDRPNLKAASRERYVKLAKSWNIQVVAVTFPGTFDHVAPTKDEGFDFVCPHFIAKEMTLSGSW